MEETNRKRGRDQVDEEIGEKEEEVVAAKRSREEEEQDDEEQGRTKNGSFDDILSLLESEEDEPSNPYLSSFMTTLQQELSSSSSSSSSSEPTQPAGTEPDGAQFDRPDPLSDVVDAPQPQEVMRYLLEASDDELGIPASPVDPSPLEREGGEGEAEALLHQSYVEREGIDQLDFDEKGLPSGVLERESLSFDGLWEMEDQRANYYDFLNSQLCYDDLKIEI
uniref:Uncharacterized protein n=2 Tax=Nymphaea colorata TaxID=210225 RepID=A0A5K1AS57_9MAGN